MVSKAKEPLGCERILFRNIQIPSVVFEYGAVEVGTCTAARWSAVTSHRFPRRRVLPRHLSTACGTSHVCSVWFESQHGGKGERRELGASAPGAGVNSESPCQDPCAFLPPRAVPTAAEG